MIDLHPPKSAAEQTRASWAKLIECFDEVPARYQPFFKTFLATGQELPYTILAPSYEGFIHRTTGKIICLLDQDIVVLQMNADSCQTQRYPLGGICLVEMSTVLLDSHLKISGVDMEGTPLSTTIRFNTVTDYLFQPLLEKIRRGCEANKESTPEHEAEKFTHWASLSFKFMNYARRSVMRDERVIDAILQPELRQGVIKVLGKTFYRTLSPTHAIILSDRELILIREEARPKDKERYGGIWNYLPLRKITNITLSEKTGSPGFVLSIEVANGERIDCLYGASAEFQTREFLERYHEMNVG